MRSFSLLLLLLCKALFVMSSGPPWIEGGDEVVIKKDSKLTLKCKGDEQPTWYREYYNNADHVTEETQNVSTFTISETYADDSGYFYCHYGTDFNMTDKNSFAAVYVFVTGGDIFPSDIFTPEIHVNVSGILKIGCRTFYPDVNVTLWKQKIPVSIGEGTRITFDNKEGFTIENVMLSDSGKYECRSGDEAYAVKVKVTGGQIRISPNIDQGNNQHFVKGENFYLICSVVDHTKANMYWEWPNKKINHTSKRWTEKRNSASYLKSNLTVMNASFDDTGTYTCIVHLPHNTPSPVTTNITVIEEMASFVKVNSSKIIQPSEEKPNVTWNADVRFYPPNPTIEYTNWKKEKLFNTEKISLERDDYQGHLMLKFASINGSDFGNYTVSVKTADGAAEGSATVLFQIKSAPHMSFQEFPGSLTVGKSHNATCSAQGFPIPEVRMTFQSCSSKYSCNPSSLIQIEQNETHYPPPGNVIQKTILYKPKTSGILVCHGKNDLGSSNATQDVRVSDIDGIFVLRHTGQDGKIAEVEDPMKVTIIENDDFSLMCAGSKFEYDKVELKQKGSEVKEDDSELSWKKKIIAKKATRSVEGNHTCIAYDFHDHKQIKSIYFTVVEEQPVRFEEESNMNNTIMEVQSGAPFNISCNVTGCPAPTIYWLRDNKNLTSESKFFDKKSMAFSSDQKTLEFDYVHKKHEGTYTCIAENRKNDVMMSLTIKVPDTDTNLEVTVVMVSVFIAMAVLIVVIVFLILRVRKERKIQQAFIDLEKDLFQKGKLELLSPASTVDAQAELLPCDMTKWEVSRSNITVGTQLGSGAFGRVVKATVTGLQAADGPTTVAIKMCKDALDVSQTRALALELKIMMHLGKHLNIVNLMGCSTVELKKGELWILVEYCRFGNLINFMQRHRKRFTNLVCQETGKINHHLVPCSPLSPSFNTNNPQTPAIDEAEYLVPNASKIVLSDPPLGHSARTITTNDSPSDNSTFQRSAGQLANNPLYHMGIGGEIENVKNEPVNSKHSQEIKNLPSQDSRSVSDGSDTLPDTNSSHPRHTQDTITTTGTQQSFCHTPLSPTDSYFGEKTFDNIQEIGNVAGVNAPFCTVDLISWGWQVAQGMDYLSRRKILHGDLAARNILLGNNNTVKISDFGLSRNVYKNENYVKEGKNLLLPVMWMSVEAIRDRIFSIQSDVWSFGITLWEIFSLGCAPYPGMNCSDFLQLLEDGYRMSCPKFANDKIYKIMRQCWEADPMQRPSFGELGDNLGLMMMPDLKEGFLSENDTYMKMNTERFREETDYLNMMAIPNFENITSPEKEEVGDPSYVNVSAHTRSSDLARSQLPDTVVYANAKIPFVSSSIISTAENNYLPMIPVKLQVSPTDVFSPQPIESSRFTFPANNLGDSKLSPPPEETPPHDETDELTGISS